jgi:chaperone modulatory protein CbpM
MVSANELVAAIGPLQEDALLHWIELGWVTPARDTRDVLFDQADVARVRLICELHYDLSIEEDSMAVVLSLLDQLYTVRRGLGVLMSAVAAQPDDVRAQIAAHVDRKVGH